MIVAKSTSISSLYTTNSYMYLHRQYTYTIDPYVFFFNYTEYSDPTEVSRLVMCYYMWVSVPDDVKMLVSQ